jgi:hypothetical protein
MLKKRRRGPILGGKVILEFLIKPTEVERFDLHRTRFADVLRPNSFTSTEVQGLGDHRISVGDTEISFSFEVAGIQVSFEKGSIPTETARQIVREIAQNIEVETGQTGTVIGLEAWEG